MKKDRSSWLISLEKESNEKVIHKKKIEQEVSSGVYERRMSNFNILSDKIERMYKEDILPIINNMKSIEIDIVRADDSVYIGIDPTDGEFFVEKKGFMISVCDKDIFTSGDKADYVNLDWGSVNFHDKNRSVPDRIVKIDDLTDLKIETMFRIVYHCLSKYESDVIEYNIQYFLSCYDFDKDFEAIEACVRKRKINSDSDTVPLWGKLALFLVGLVLLVVSTGAFITFLLFLFSASL
jgi:hypothetical protein